MLFQLSVSVTVALHVTSFVLPAAKSIGLGLIETVPTVCEPAKTTGTTAIKSKANKAFSIFHLLFQGKEDCCYYQDNNNKDCEQACQPNPSSAASYLQEISCNKIRPFI